MRVKVIDSNSSSCRSKVTRRSAIIGQKLITITASHVIFQNARRKWFAEKPSPSHISLRPAPKCSLSNQQSPHAFLCAGRDRPSKTQFPPPPASQGQSLQWGVCCADLVTLCAVTGVFWPHLSLCETMRRPGKQRGSGKKRL